MSHGAGGPCRFATFRLAPSELGPFYKKGAPNKTNMRVAREPGLPLRIPGRILDTRGEPVHDARVDVWHADYKGIYHVHGYRYRANELNFDYPVKVILWVFAFGPWLHAWTAEHAVQGLVFSPDGTSVAVADGSKGVKLLAVPNKGSASKR